MKILETPGKTGRVGRYAEETEATELPEGVAAIFPCRNLVSRAFPPPPPPNQGKGPGNEVVLAEDMVVSGLELVNLCETRK